MIYLFYTSLALAAVVSIGTIKAQMAHIKGLKGMHKEESGKAHARHLELLDLKAKLSETEDTKQTWARLAHEASEDLNFLTRVHSGEIEAMQTRIYHAELYMQRVREQKRRCERKRREARNATSKD